MKRRIILLTCSVLCSTLIGCADMSQRENVGAVSGGVVGGLVGSQLGSGNGQLTATGLGVLMGSMVGKSIGSSMDKANREEISHSLETAPTGKTASWNNPDNQDKYTVTPTMTYTEQAGQPCREFTTTATIAGKESKAYGTACRQADGSWKIVSSN